MEFEIGEIKSHSENLVNLVKKLCENKSEKQIISFFREALDIMFGTSSIYVYVANINTHKVVYYNAGLKEAFSIPEGDLYCDDILKQCSNCTHCEFLTCNIDKLPYEWELYIEELDRYFNILDNIITLNDTKYKFSIIIEITERKKAEEYLTFKLNFEYCLKNILKSFLKVRDFNESLTLALKEIGILVSASRAYILEYRQCQKQVIYSSEWCNKEKLLTSLLGTCIDVKNIPWWKEDIQNEAIIFYNNDKDAKLASELNSLIAAPIMVNEKFLGLICIEGITYGEWFDFAFDGIKLCSEILASAYEKNRFEEELKRKSYIDGLTSAHNRAYFQYLMKEYGNSDNVGVLLCDLNCLKLINDNLGHKFGDDVLKITANILKDTIGNEGTVCRIGGDEFGLIMLNKSKEELICIKNKVKKAMIAFVDEFKFFPISLSIGYAVRDSTDYCIMDIFKEADNLMYKDKIKYRKINKEKMMDYITRYLNKEIE